MYSVELVQAAIQQCLARRGFKYPRHNERGKDSNTARMLAFDAMFALTGGSVTGSAVNVNASLIFSSEELPANPSALQDFDKDSKIHAETSCLHFLQSLNISNPSGFVGKCPWCPVI
jgi:hypothetical protein